jgi:inhibitor of cysteine peptidase
MKNSYRLGHLRQRFLIIVALGMLLNFIPITTLSACIEELDSQANLANTIKTASYVFQGTIKEMVLPQMVIQVAQYFKGYGPDTVTITEVGETCEPPLTVDQEAIFVVKPTTNQSVPTVITSQELSLIQPISPEIIAEITAAIDCMATYYSELGKVHIPCLAVNQGSDGIYSVDLSLKSSNEPLLLAVDSAQPQKPFTTQQPAYIKQINIQVGQSLPVQVKVLVRGELSDTCQKMAPIQVVRQADAFDITITTMSNLPPPGLDCSSMLIPFEEVIPLDVTGLADGIYTVNVNEMSDTFELAQDDIQFKAPIEQVDLQVLESFPVQVNVKVKGWFTNGCQQIDQIKVTPTDNTFMVTMTTTPPPPLEIACTMALAPFEKTIALDVQGLKQGVYTVDVNGIRKQFELAVDNVVVGN